MQKSSGFSIENMNKSSGFSIENMKKLTSFSIEDMQKSSGFSIEKHKEIIKLSRRRFFKVKRSHLSTLKHGLTKDRSNQKLIFNFGNYLKIEENLENFKKRR